MNYNLVLYIGLFLIVGGFCLFLLSQMRLRQLDIEEWKNQQLTKSFNKEKNDLKMKLTIFSVLNAREGEERVGLFLSDGHLADVKSAVLR